MVATLIDLLLQGNNNDLYNKIVLHIFTTLSKAINFFEYNILNVNKPVIYDGLLEQLPAFPRYDKCSYTTVIL